MRRDLIRAARELREAVRELRFDSPVTHVYNPLEYAWEVHRTYLATYGQPPKRVLFLGMNPGPFGMVQTGVPFGEIRTVRDWLQLDGRIHPPEHQHPRRPIEGLECRRSEVSGQRLWGLFEERFRTPQAFFKEHFVANFCPLAFLDQAGRNVTPDKLPARRLEPLLEACNEHLRQVVSILQPQFLIGVGGFATQRAQAVCSGMPVKIGTVLHPSPANPAANRGWAVRARSQLRQLGLWSTDRPSSKG